MIDQCYAKLMQAEIDAVEGSKAHWLRMRDYARKQAINELVSATRMNLELHELPFEDHCPLCVLHFCDCSDCEVQASTALSCSDNCSPWFVTMDGFGAGTITWATWADRIDLLMIPMFDTCLRQLKRPNTWDKKI